MIHRSFALLLAPLLAASASAQVFVSAPGQIPADTVFSENVDFGDIDLDGDWDAVFADGGDFGNVQNHVWINQGGLQAGTLGTFADDTAARAPAVIDSSRDIDFVDIDSDGDLDTYVSNTSDISNQTNRWWVNNGGLQGGTPGFFTDETAARWVNLAGVGSSIPPQQVLVDGGFIDWSCDCDLGDIDNDGDMDLVHSTYGAAFDGNTPTRLFLNDGDGFFEEFNPSGFQLVTTELNDGDPGIWAEGLQQDDTPNATGAFCDVAGTALDVDLADVDGDLDLDIVFDVRNEAPRMFQNRLAETGSLAFRDVSRLAFPTGFASGVGHYEVELGDLDGDDDLDLYGVNWLAGASLAEPLTDIVMENDGTGSFGNLEMLDTSNIDDNEADFVDYDNDGDLDVFVSGFFGLSRLYENGNDGGSGYDLTWVDPVSSGLAATSSTVDQDTEIFDVDGDGDYDALIATAFNQAALLFINQTQVPDTTAPRVRRLELLADQSAAPSNLAVRGHVYDNAPYYVTWLNPTELVATVDGIDLPPFAMQASGGQVFRGELPGNLVGQVEYTMRSSDLVGNSGASTTESYTGSTGLAFASAYGSATNGAGLGVPPRVQALSVPFPDSTLYLGVADVSPGVFVLVGMASASAPSIPIPGQLVLNLGGTLFAAFLAPASADGELVLAFPLGATVPSGAALYFQAYALEGTGGQVWSSSQGLEVTVP